MSGELVLVTGGSGFIGVHCIVQLLEAGYRVRTSLRSLARADEVRAMVVEGGADAAGVEFVELDLQRDDGWLEAATGATYVLHVASPFPPTQPKDPDELIVPYVRMPEDVVPGKPLFYATAMSLGGVATGLLVESHEGRPTKIEGNPDHPASRGGTDLFAQASVLDLYDPDRSQTVIGKGEIRPWSELSLALMSAGAGQKGAGGAGLRILSGAVTSPTLAAQIQAVLKAAPQAKWIQYEAIGCDNARAGSKQAFGEYVEPVYRLDQTDVILSLDADLLDSGGGKLRYARDFAARRRVMPGQTGMTRLYVAESIPTNTGSKADHRLSLKARDIPALARAIAAGLGVAGASGQAPQAATAFATEVVKDLQAHRFRVMRSTTSFVRRLSISSARSAARNCWGCYATSMRLMTWRNCRLCSSLAARTRKTAGNCLQVPFKTPERSE